MASVAITTICDMVEHCRIRLDDLSPDAIEPTTNLELVQEAAEIADESDLLWSTNELRTYANQAIREVAIRTFCLRDTGRDAEGLTSYPIVSPENTITVDNRVLEIKRVWWNDTVLTPASALFLDQAENPASAGSWRTNETDEPCQFVLDRSSRELHLVGLPTSDGTIKLDVIRLPLAEIEKGKPEIPQSYLYDCLDWMCHLAYKKNDADTVDPVKSERYEQSFTATVGPRQSNHQLQLGYHHGGRRRPRLYYH